MVCYSSSRHLKYQKVFSFCHPVHGWHFYCLVYENCKDVTVCQRLENDRTTAKIQLCIVYAGTGEAIVTELYLGKYYTKQLTPYKKVQELNAVLCRTARLNKTKNAKIIVTLNFWHHIADDTIREYVKEKGYLLVELGDLGDNNAYKAMGFFEHSGVTNHTNDFGMKEIANRIYPCIKGEIIG